MHTLINFLRLDFRLYPHLIVYHFRRKAMRTISVTVWQSGSSRIHRRINVEEMEAWCYSSHGEGPCNLATHSTRPSNWQEVRARRDNPPRLSNGDIVELKCVHSLFQNILVLLHGVSAYISNLETKLFCLCGLLLQKKTTFSWSKITIKWPGYIWYI